MHNYTQSIVDRYFDYVTDDADMIWSDIGSISKSITSGNWKTHYKSVISRYNLSSRFTLMRIMFDKAIGISNWKYVDDNTLKKGFSVEGIGEFPNISIEHANAMTSDEVERYKQLLLKRSMEFDPDSTQKAERLIECALEITEEGKKTNLSREEVILLGHLLDLSLSDVDYYLLRVLSDNEAGLRYGLSSDVIDIYGFITHAKLCDVNGLKQWYKEWCSNNKKSIKRLKFENKPLDWTRNIANTFQATVNGWPEDQKIEKMKEWLISQTPYLDMPSAAAMRVYKNMAMYAYALLKPVNKKNIDGTYLKDFGGVTLYDDMLMISELNDYHENVKFLRDKNGRLSAERCEIVADAIMLENREMAGVFKGDSTKPYHAIHLEKGEISVRGKINAGWNNGRKRLSDILSGTINPTKGDILVLLWFIANYWWQDETDNANEITRRLLDFLDSAKVLLRSALLPAFYPPNILEETMMMSIVYEDIENSPAMIYEAICSTFVVKQEKKPKDAKKRSIEDRIKIIEYYLENKDNGLSQAECAKLFGVGKASVTNWLKDYREGKYKPI